MQRLISLICAGLLLLAACNGARTPNNANFAHAINEYLAKHGGACTVIGRHFPMDVPASEQKEQYGIAPKLVALEEAGLVRGINTMAVVHGMLEPLRGAGPAQPVKRYALTADGQKYFRQIAGAFSQTSGFCYGQKGVDAIVKWTDPVNSQTEVTYTYQIVNLATWAQRPEIQQVFPDIRTAVNGASKTTEIAGLQLTNNGWEVVGQ